MSDKMQQAMDAPVAIPTRHYSLYEIDEMRGLIHRLKALRKDGRELGGAMPHHVVEAELRTAMSAGLTHEDINAEISRLIEEDLKNAWAEAKEKGEEKFIFPMNFNAHLSGLFDKFSGSMTAPTYSTETGEILSEDEWLPCPIFGCFEAQ